MQFNEKQEVEQPHNNNKLIDQFQDQNNQNYQELPLRAQKHQNEQIGNHSPIDFMRIASYLQQKLALETIKKWVNYNWKTLQLLSVFLMLFVFITILLLIYQSYKFPSLQQTKDNFNSKSIEFDQSRFHNSRLEQYSHLRLKTETRSTQNTQLQRKQLKMLSLQKNIIELNKKIRRQQKQQSKLTRTHQKLHQNIEKKQTHNRIQTVNPEQDKKYIKNIVKGSVQTRFPKIVWMYFEQSVKMESNLTQTLVNNIEQYLAANDYQFYMITKENFNFIMNNRNEEQLGFVLADLWHKAYETNQSSNLPDHALNIKKQLISLIMLSESGGILIDKEIILTEDLSWLQQLDSLSYVNKGRSKLPNVVGFHYRNYTSWAQKVAISEYEDREIHLYPSLDPYFLAVSKEGCEFIKLVLQKYYLLVENYDKVKQLMHQYHLGMFQISGNDPYFESYYIAFTMVLKQKQMEFDAKWLASDKQELRELAIDYYGIYSINRLYGPLRYRLLFSDQSYEDIYFTFSKVQNSQLIRYYGNIQLMTFIPFQYGMAQYLQEAESGNQKYAILKNSFFHKYVYTNYDEAEFIIDSLPNFAQQIASPITVIWKNLPRIIWIYLDENITQNIIQRLCLHNIKNTALQSGFELNIITDANIEQYISKQNLDQIDQIAFSRYIDYPEIRNELIELTILKQYGGIWIELPLFTIENLNWVLHINRNQYVINKLGKLPKVLLFYHPIFSRFQWKVHNDSSVQLKQDLSYLKCFIAAQKKSELISLWLSELKLNFQMQTFQLQQKFIVNYKVPSFDITKNQKEIFKYSLISILVNQGKKYNSRVNGKEVTMAQKCGLWILNGFLGSEKLKQFTNYEKGYDYNNVYLWSHSQTYVRRLLGQFHYFVSLNEQEEGFLNWVLESREGGREQIRIHSNSIFQNYLYNATVLQQIFNNVTAEELMAVQELSQHIPKDVWLYVEGRSMQTEDYLKRCINNILHYSKGYRVHYITVQNIKEFVTMQMRLQLQGLFEEIDKLTNYSPQTIYNIKKRVAILSIMAEKGGVFIDNNVILTEPLDWIHKINKNVFVNGGYNTINKVVGFFAINQYSKINRHSNIQQLINPILQPFFIAALKNTTFIKDLLSQYLTTVRQDHVQLSNRLANHENYVRAVQQIELFYLASNLTLYKKQITNTERLMTDYYGLSLINSRYFPKKLDYVYSNLAFSSLFNSLCVISEQQLRGYFGPLSYMIQIPKAQQIFNMIESSKVKKNSVLHNHLFLGLEDRHVEHYLERKIDINTVWQQLPKIIWYWPTVKLSEQYINSKIYTKIFQMANQAGFDMIQVSAENITQYTQPNNTIQNNSYDVDQVLSKIKLEMDREAVVQFINKMQLIDIYGGIILPSNFIPTDNLNWLVNLGQINSDFIYNRFGIKPKILTFFRQTPPQFYNYTINQNYGIKVNSNITVLTNFIAAVKHTQFIQQLLYEFIQFMTMTKEHITEVSKQYEVSFNTDKIQIQQFVCSVVKFIINRKEKQLSIQGSELSPLEYYGIWSINQDVGPNKWLPNLNLNSQMDQSTKLKLWFSANSDYVNQVIGRPNFFLSLTPENKQKLSFVIFDQQARSLQLQRLHKIQFEPMQ